MALTGKTISELDLLQFPTNVTKDASDTNNYVTFLSAGTIVAQTITV